jgi:uncharacterized protein involved in outer membrane biogenesis
VAAAVASILLAAAGAIAWRLRSLDEETVRRALVARLEAALGTKAQVRRAEVSLLSGVRLEGLQIANPPPLAGRLLEAEAFVLRYRPWPLLLGRVEVDRLALVRPALSLRMDRRGLFNYERLAPPRGGATAVPLPLRVRLRKVSVENGSVSVSDAAGAALARVEGVGFSAAIELDGDLATGTGDARVATLALGDRLFLRDAGAPLRLTREEVVLAPIRAHAAGGDAKGEATVRLGGGFRYAVSLALDGSRVETMLAEAKAAPWLAGRLRGRASFEGAGGLATVRGRGEAEVSGCRLAGSRAAALLATALGLPELERPEFDDCRLSFTQTGARVRVPSLVMKGRALELAGRGSSSLDTGALDYDMTLALAPALFARVTRPELRPAFRTRPDGFAEIGFRLTGTTLAPRTDLAARIAKGAAGHAITDQLSRWLGLKKKER